MIKIKLHWQILIGIILGVLYGVFLSEYIQYISWTGTIFLRALKMIVIPLVLTSLITGVSKIGSSASLGRLGLKTIIYYLSTSLIALFTGLILVNIIHPGTSGSIEIPESGNVNLNEKTISEILIEIIPSNIFEVFQTNDHLLSVIFIALFFGFFITRLPSGSKDLLLNIFSSLFELIMKITLFIIRFAPIGIFGLVAKSIAEQSDLLKLMETLGKFTVTSLSALIFHFFITLPLLLIIIGKINPLKHFKAMAVPLLTAFSTASSNATLPLTMEQIENESKVSNKISSFTLPLGATINMDGTALYELVVAIFIAQLLGINLPFSKQIIVIFTALLASIGTAGIPMASFTTMSIIFTAVGLPLEAVAIILPIDRLLDMCRTATNVWSDSCGAVIIAKTEGEQVYK